jgi:dihydroorotate dehydrogenase electron transfer subunit
MRSLSATVVRNEPLGRSLMRLTLAAGPLGSALPGQWLAVYRPSALTIVAQPFPLASPDVRAGSAAILYDRDEALASWLAVLPPGTALDVLGPWGRPFPIDGRARHVLLLATGARLLGVLALAAALVESGVAVVVLHDAPTATALVPPALLPHAAEYHVATADGTAGVAGTALDLLPPLLPWADALYAALPAEAYLTLRDLVHRHRLRVRRGFATVVAEGPLACYAAACDGCAVPLRDGYGLLCKDGPAFDLLDLA